MCAAAAAFQYKHSSLPLFSYYLSFTLAFLKLFVENRNSISGVVLVEYVCVFAGKVVGVGCSLKTWKVMIWFVSFSYSIRFCQN